MNRARWEKLQVGDIIQNQGSGKAYVLVLQIVKATRGQLKSSWVASRTIQAENASEWRKVTK